MDAFQIFIHVSFARRVLIVELHRLKNQRVSQLVLESLHSVMLPVALLILDGELLNLVSNALFLLLPLDSL